ncbi:MAG: hypothetical protein MUC49_10250 [Raineya sp.]|nr:hypothetical protein [Raineya sp.]
MIQFDKSDIEDLNDQLFINLIAQDEFHQWKSTNLSGKKKIRWKDFNVKVTGGIFNKQCSCVILSMSTLLNHPKNQLYIEVSSKKNPKIYTYKLIHIPKPIYFYTVFKTNILAPDNPIPIHMVIDYDNGMTYTTNDTIRRIRWSDFRVESPFWDKIKHHILMPRDSFDIINHVFVKTIHLPTKQSYTLQIPIRYNATYTLDFSGINGRDGQEPPEASAGEKRESKGINGYTGQEGENGYDAEDVTIFVESVPRLQDTLLHIQVFSKGKADFVNINVQQGLLKFTAKGGKGGMGGRGGKGEDGLEKTDSTRAGYGGDGGIGGRGGNGGKGAKVMIFTDSLAAFYVEKNIQIENIGGDGGIGGIGGKKGRGGSLFMDGYEGEKGKNGNKGEDGGPPIIQILSIEQMLEKRKLIYKKE